jgi:hypothetical protein
MEACTLVTIAADGALMDVKIRIIRHQVLDDDAANREDVAPLH